MGQERDTDVIIDLFLNAKKGGLDGQIAKALHIVAGLCSSNEFKGIGLIINIAFNLLNTANKIEITNYTVYANSNVERANKVLEKLKMIYSTL